MKKIPFISSPAHWRKAVANLQERDSSFRKLSRQVAPFSFTPRLSECPFESLLRAIVSQQLSTRAANTIYGRLLNAVQVKGKPSARKILRLDQATLRQAGLSGQKVTYVKDLAQQVVRKKLPDLELIHSMPDQNIIELFTHIRGVGRWTVEMYLIFNLGRLDVWPVDDLGIRKGLMQLHQLTQMPTAKTALPYGEAWTPYRTVATLYLWRLLNNSS
jgi:DNA-3-methyladenine glycosylase II